MGNVGVDACDQLCTGLREVGASRRGRVVAVAGGRGTAVEVSGAGEVLADQSRANDFAVLRDEAAIGLSVEEEMGEGGRRERVEHTQQKGADGGEQDGDTQ